MAIESGNNSSWKQHFRDLPGDDEGNQNMFSFTNFCKSTTASNVTKLRELTEEKDTVFFGTTNGKVLILHSPINFGGTRARKTNNLACLLGLGPEAIGVILKEESQLQKIQRSIASKDP